MEHSRCGDSKREGYADPLVNSIDPKETTLSNQPTARTNRVQRELICFARNRADL